MPEWQGAEEDEEEEPLGEELDEDSRPEGTSTENDKKLLDKLHVNMGHPDRERFVRVLRAGGVRRSVLSWIKAEFKCPECDDRRRRGERRRVALERKVSCLRLP